VHSDGFEDYGFTEIRVTQIKELDSCYKGRPLMDWDDPEDRAEMVKYAGFVCSYKVDEPDCEQCQAKACCERARDER